MAGSPLRGSGTNYALTGDYTQLSQEELDRIRGSQPGEFFKGVRRGASGLTAGAYAKEALDAELSDGVDSPEYQSALRRALEVSGESAKLDAPAVSSLRDINSVGAAGDYLAGTVGQGLVSMAPVLGTALLTRGRGRIGNATAYGGAVVPAYQMEKGGAVLEQYSDPELAARSVQERDEAASMGAAGSAALEALVPAGISKLAVAPAKSFAKEVGKNALEEGLTETAQKVIGHTAQNTLRAKPEELSGWDLADAFVGGVATGGVAAGTLGAPAQLADMTSQRLAVGREPGQDNAPPRGPIPLGPAPSDKISVADAAKQRLSDIADRYNLAVKGGAPAPIALDTAFEDPLASAGMSDLDVADAAGAQTPEELAAAFQAYEEARPTRTATYAEHLMADKNTPDDVRARIAGMQGDYTSPENQSYVEQTLLTQTAANKVKAGVKAVQDFVSEEGPKLRAKIQEQVDKVGGRIVKPNLQDIDLGQATDLVNGLAAELGNDAHRAPEMARQLIEFSAALEGTKALTPKLIETLAGIEASPALMRMVEESASLSPLREVLQRAQALPGAVNDVRGGNSFLESVLPEGLPRRVVQGIAELVDEHAAGHSGEARKDKARIPNILVDAFGGQDRAEAVLRHYGEARRAAFAREAELDAGPADNTRMASQQGEVDLGAAAKGDQTYEDMDNPEAQAMDAGITVQDAQALEPAYRDANQNRPFLRGRDDKERDARMTEAGTSGRVGTMTEALKARADKQPDAGFRIRRDTAAKDLAAAEARGASKEELEALRLELRTLDSSRGDDIPLRAVQMRQDLRKLMQTAADKDRPSVQAMVDALKAQPKLDAEQTKYLATLEKRLADPKLKENPALARHRAEYEQQNETIRKALKEKKDPFTAMLDMYDVVLREESDVQASDEQITKFGEGLKRSRKNDDAYNAETKRTKITFRRKKASGATVPLNLSMESMIFNAKTRGNAVQQLADSIAAVLARADIEGMETPANDAIVMRRKGGEHILWGDVAKEVTPRKLSPRERAKLAKKKEDHAAWLQKQADSEAKYKALMMQELEKLPEAERLDAAKEWARKISKRLENAEAGKQKNQDMARVRVLAEFINSELDENLPLPKQGETAGLLAEEMEKQGRETDSANIGPELQDLEEMVSVLKDRLKEVKGIPLLENRYKKRIEFIEAQDIPALIATTSSPQKRTVADQVQRSKHFVGSEKQRVPKITKTLPPKAEQEAVDSKRAAFVRTESTSNLVHHFEMYRDSPENTQNRKDILDELKRRGSLNIWAGSNQNKELSNLAPRPFKYKGKDYFSVEHAYQTLKSGEFDADTYAKYTRGKTEKIRGKAADTKNGANYELMHKLIEASFQQNPDAAKKLMETGEKLLTHQQDKGVWRKAFPTILMDVRDSLREQAQRRDEDAAYYDTQREDMSDYLTDEELNEIEANNAKVVLPKTSPFTAKDQKKSDQANKFIGRGSPGSSTDAYAKAWGDRANTGSYNKDDRVFVSSNGARKGAVAPDFTEIKKAVDAGATLITDDAANRARSFNTGERKVAEFLTANGYTEQGDSGVWTPAPKKSAMNPKTKGKPKDASQEQQDAIRAEILRTRGKDVQVAFRKFLKHEGSGQFSMDADGQNRLIEVALNAANPMGVAFHESLHDFFATLPQNETGRSIKRDLEAAATGLPIMNQLRKLLRGHDAAIKQIEDSPEEAVAYMYQFWSEGLLNVGPRTGGILHRVTQLIRGVLGIVGTHTRAEDLMVALHEGKFADPSVVAEVLADMSADTIDNKLHKLAPGLSKAVDKLVVAAPDRLREFRNDQLNTLADKFSSEKGRLGFIQRRFQQQGVWENRLAKIFDGTTSTDRRVAIDNLQAMKAPNTQLEKDIAQLLSEMHSYMVNAGVQTKDSETGKWVPIRQVKNYFPRVFDRNAIMSDIDGWNALLKANGVSKDQRAKITAAIVHGSGQLDLAETEHHLGFTPFAQSVEDRKLTFIDKTNAADFARFQSKDMADILTGYIKQAVHRAEYAKEFGNDGEQITDLIAKSGISDKKELEEISTVVRALEGTAGADMSSSTKEIMGGIMTAQNLVLLPLSIFSQMIDPVVLAARSGDLRDAGRAYATALTRLKNVVTRNKDDKVLGQDLADILGIVSADSTLEAMGNAYGSMYMSRRVRDVNRKFFRYNGMQGWNDSMRIAATAAGERYLVAKAQDKEALAELGLSVGDVKTLPDGSLDVSDLKVREAMFRFVDQAVLRPSASQRPSWMSDPRFILLSHLKQFTFAMHNVVLKRATQQFMKGDAKPWAILLLAAPTILAADMAKMALSGNVPTNWGFMDYLTHAVNRSGLLGLGDFGAQVAGDSGHGKIPGESLLGPSFENLAAILRWLGGDARTDFVDVAKRTVPGVDFAI